MVQNELVDLVSDLVDAMVNNRLEGVEALITRGEALVRFAWVQANAGEITHTDAMAAERLLASTRTAMMFISALWYATNDVIFPCSNGPGYVLQYDNGVSDKVFETKAEAVMKMADYYDWKHSEEV
jgi:hypothetical protein